MAIIAQEGGAVWLSWRVFARVAKEPRMAEYHREMAPLVVPGSHRWEILRVRE